MVPINTSAYNLRQRIQKFRRTIVDQAQKIRNLRNHNRELLNDIDYLIELHRSVDERCVQMEKKPTLLYQTERVRVIRSVSGRNEWNKMNGTK